jgi:hypothetical protein
LFVADGLDFHRRLIGLDLGEHIAGMNLVTLLFEPHMRFFRWSSWRYAGKGSRGGVALLFLSIIGRQPAAATMSSTGQREALGLVA